MKTYILCLALGVVSASPTSSCGCDDPVREPKKSSEWILFDSAYEVADVKSGQYEILTNTYVMPLNYGCLWRISTITPGHGVSETMTHTLACPTLKEKNNVENSGRFKSKKAFGDEGEKQEPVESFKLDSWPSPAASSETNR